MSNIKFIFINPSFVFGFFLLISLSSTFLQWSDLFGIPSDETITIYVTSSLVLVVLSLFFHYKLTKNKIFTSGALLYSFQKSKNDKIYFISLVLFFYLEVLYSGFIPILLGVYSDVLELSFGLPILHGLFLSFLSYISVVYFQKYLVTRKKEYIFYILVINAMFILLGRRGIIVFNMFSYMFLYLYYYFAYKQINFKLILNFLLLIVTFFYIFNYIGNLRLGKSSDEYILSVGQASNKFVNSNIPSSAFFTYLYVSSPVSIFDINNYSYNTSYREFIMANILPDFITKRLGYKEKLKVNDINGFTVGGIFAKPYMYKGITGIVIIMIYYLLLYFLVMYIVLKNRKRSIVLLSMFLSMSVLLTFQNLLNYSGYILQIYFAILFKDLLLFKYGKNTILPIRRLNEKD